MPSTVLRGHTQIAALSKKVKVRIRIHGYTISVPNSPAILGHILATVKISIYIMYITYNLYFYTVYFALVANKELMLLLSIIIFILFFNLPRFGGTILHRATKPKAFQIYHITFNLSHNN